jgi:hypothetical protein
MLLEETTLELEAGEDEDVGCKGNMPFPSIFPVVPAGLVCPLLVSPLKISDNERLDELVKSEVVYAA